MEIFINVLLVEPVVSQTFQKVLYSLLFHSQQLSQVL